MKIIKKVVITGGPCGGKTSAIKWIKKAFTKKGYQIIVIPETATELISSGVAPWTCSSRLEYQRCQMRMQLEKEKIYEQAAGVMPSDKILIVCDRGALDNKAYMSEEEFVQVLRDIQCTESELMGRYDAVFHLVTAAKGAEEFYTTANNAARTETLEEAAALDDLFVDAWGEHPYYTLIDNSGDFEDKMQRLITEMKKLLKIK